MARAFGVDINMRVLNTSAIPRFWHDPRHAPSAKRANRVGACAARAEAPRGKR